MLTVSILVLTDIDMVSVMGLVNPQHEPLIR